MSLIRQMNKKNIFGCPGVFIYFLFHFVLYAKDEEYKKEEQLHFPQIVVLKGRLLLS